MGGSAHNFLKWVPQTCLHILATLYACIHYPLLGINATVISRRLEAHLPEVDGHRHPSVHILRSLVLAHRRAATPQETATATWAFSDLRLRRFYYRIAGNREPRGC